MAETYTGTDGSEYFDGGDGQNIYDPQGGDDLMMGMDGENTILFGPGDGVDTLYFAVPRTYQYANFLTNAQAALAELASFTGTTYTNSYFSDIAPQSLIDSLPSEIGSILQMLRPQDDGEGTITPGGADPNAVYDAMTALIAWINAPVSNVIQLDAGITPQNLFVQVGAMSALGVPREFAVSIGGDEAIVFQLGTTEDMAGDSSTPPDLNITFHFADGSTMTIGDLLAQASPENGIVGTQIGSVGDDVLLGSMASDSVSGDQGDDKIDVGASFDYVSGGLGNDAIAGGAGFDYLYGDEGDDVIAGEGDGALVNGGTGNDTYVFNSGDGNLIIDNGGSGLPGETDTISFGMDVDPSDIVAYVDPSTGNLNLMVQGTGDLIQIQWFAPWDGMAVRPDQVIQQAQFIDAAGNVRVFDLEALVAGRFDELTGASASDPLALFDAGSAAYEITGTVDAAGGEYAMNYALRDDLFDGGSVAPNLAPVEGDPIAQQVAQEDAEFSFTVPAGAFVDANGDPLMLSASNSGGPLPAWLSFDPATGTFSGTPDNGEVGSYAIMVTATDPSGASVSQTFEIVVQNTNDAPIVVNAVADQTVDEDSSFSLQIGNVFSDVDAGDSLTLDVGTLPDWLSYDPTTGLLSGTPDNGDVGTYTITLTATDAAGASTEEVFDIVVNNTNDAPTVVNAQPDVTIDEDAPLLLDLAQVFADEDVGDQITVTVGIVPTRGSGWLSYDPATGLLTGTPSNSEVGTYTVILTATDLAGASAEYSFTITVNNINDAPIVVAPIADQTVDEDTTLSLNVSGVFSDVDAGDILTVSVDAPAWLTYDAQTGELSGTPGNADVGVYSVTLTATDLAGASVQQLFSITVNNVNDAPTVANPVADQSVDEDTAFLLDLSQVFADEDVGDQVTVTVGIVPTRSSGWLSYDAATGLLTGTPSNSEVGTYEVILTATDTSGAVAEHTFTITVNNVNDAPTVANAVADQAATEDALFSFTVPADTFADVDAGDSLRLSATLADGSALPTWLSFDSDKWTFSGTPTNDDVGTLNVRVTAVDSGGLPVSDTFDITVANTNDAPELVQPIADQSATAGQAFSMTIAGDAFRDVDVGDSLSYSVTMSDGSALPTWLTFNPDTRTLSGTPGAAANLQLQVVATDESGATAADSFALAVAAAPRTDPPSDPVLIGGRRRDVLIANGPGDYTIYGGAGNDVIKGGSGNDTLYGGKGRDTISGGDGNDYIDGGRGRDVLSGGAGVDILQGGRGRDRIDDSAGNGLLDGGRGDDTLIGNSANQLFIGGKGDDTIQLGGGNDIIAYNRGDGDDRIIAEGSAQGTLSLGGGISLKDLVFRRSGDNLILETGGGGSITFDDWYRSGGKYQAVSTLQLITEGMSGGSASLMDDAVETFNFHQLVEAFDSASSGRRRHGVSRWALTNALTSFNLGGSDTEALGGDLAYAYGTAGSLAGIAVSAAQEILSDPKFGNAAQALQPPKELTSGSVKLV